MTEEEAMAYAIKMRVRGDTYAQIYRFISTRISEDQTEKMLAQIDRLEENNEIKVKKAKEELDTGKLLGLMFGGVFIITGIVLFFITLENNVIAGLPFWLIGIGIVAIIGGIK